MIWLCENEACGQPFCDECDPAPINTTLCPTCAEPDPDLEHKAALEARA